MSATATSVADPQNAEILTDAEVDQLIEGRDAEGEAEPEAGGEQGAKADDTATAPATPPEPNEEDRAWTAMRKNLGPNVTPAMLLAYAQKGYQGEQAAVAAAATPKPEGKTEPKPDEPKPDAKGKKPEYVSREEHEAAMKNMERRVQIQTAGAAANTKLSAMLDQAGLGEEEDPIGRRLVSEAAIKAIAAGATISAGFKLGNDEFVGYLAKKTTKVLRDKIEARSAAGDVGGGQAPAGLPPVTKMEHRFDDFDTGVAIEQATKRIEATRRGR